MQQHCRKVHGEEYMHPKKTEFRDTEKYECPDCGLPFEFKDHMKAHRRKVLVVRSYNLKEKTKRIC